MVGRPPSLLHVQRVASFECVHLISNCFTPKNVVVSEMTGQNSAHSPLNDKLHDVHDTIQIASGKCSWVMNIGNGTFLHTRCCHNNRNPGTKIFLKSSTPLHKVSGSTSLSFTKISRHDLRALSKHMRRGASQEDTTSWFLFLPPTLQLLL